MKLLVAGGAGFIGSTFIRQWLDGHPGDAVVNFDLLTYAGDRSSLVWIGSPEVLAEIAGSAVELMGTGDPNCLKACGNPGCSWLFYDTTLNHSRRYCSATPCGSLMRVRRFRQNIAALIFSRHLPRVSVASACRNKLVWLLEVMLTVGGRITLTLVEAIPRTRVPSLARMR